MEQEMRSRAVEGPRNYSKAQEAVAKHHENMSTTTSETASVSKI